MIKTRREREEKDESKNWVAGEGDIGGRQLAARSLTSSSGRPQDGGLGY